MTEAEADMDAEDPVAEEETVAIEIVVAEADIADNEIVNRKEIEFDWSVNRPYAISTL